MTRRARIARWPKARRAARLLAAALIRGHWATFLALCLNMRALLTIGQSTAPRPDRPADPFTYTLR